ncbi:MAG: transcription initiation factor IIB [Candidatus Nanohaloarchaeota archaeon QJJ-7]|nr:transcription initiation factor IIB [Candidatus Nanohaloarchaeota archaeon QJJ-7]
MEAFAEADVATVEEEPEMCPSCGSTDIETGVEGKECAECGNDIGSSKSSSRGSGFQTDTSQPSYSGIEKWQTSRGSDSTFELSELNRIISQLELPQDVHERVTELVEKAKDKGLMRGRDMNEMLSALIYIVAREEGTPRTLDEISDVTGVGKRRIGKSYRYIGREMDMRVVPPQPEDHIKRFADKLDLSDTVREEAKKIIDEAKEKEILAGKAPTGIAASALYIASNIEGEKRTQKEVAEMLNVTEVTVRNRSKELVEELGLGDQFEIQS